MCLNQRKRLVALLTAGSRRHLDISIESINPAPALFELPAPSVDERVRAHSEGNGVVAHRFPVHAA